MRILFARIGLPDASALRWAIVLQPSVLPPLYDPQQAAECCYARTERRNVGRIEQHDKSLMLQICSATAW
jgi:hypothetical protein